jgi:hypothetical protein
MSDPTFIKIVDRSLNKRSTDLEENPNDIKNGLSADTIIVNTNIISSQRISEENIQASKGQQLQENTDEMRSLSNMMQNPSNWLSCTLPWLLMNP